MFVENRIDTMRGLARLGARLCGYSLGDPDGWMAGRCDCKYGADLSKSSEQTGCPEVRCMVLLLDSMTDEQWASASSFAGGFDAWAFADPPGLPAKDAEAVAAFFGESVDKVQTVAKLSQMRDRALNRAVPSPESSR